MNPDSNNEGVRLPGEFVRDQPSVENAFALLWKDETFHDLTLHCMEDGVHVRVNRFSLAARSQTFKDLLLGENINAESVKLDYPGDVIRAIVQYIHEDTSTILEDLPKENIHNPDTPTERERLMILTKLVGASLVYDMPGLCRKAYNAIHRCLTHYPKLAFVSMDIILMEKNFFPVAKRHTFPPELLQLAKSKYWRELEFLTQHEVALWSKEVLEEIIKDENGQLTEYQLFYLLEKWCAPAENGKPENDTTIQDRRTFASNLLNFIHLKYIDPAKLSTEVANSGLLENDNRLYEAYRHQAENHYKDKKFPYDSYTRCCGPAVWEDSDCLEIQHPPEENDYDRIYCLKCPPIRSGVYRWTLEILDFRAYCFLLGIMLVPNPHSKGTYLGNQSSGWSFQNDCRTFHNKTSGEREVGHGFSRGSKVTFILNLQQDQPEKGKLEVSVDGSKPSLFLTSLRDKLFNAESGFVPAVSMCDRRDHLRIVEFQKLAD